MQYSASHQQTDISNHYSQSDNSDYSDSHLEKIDFTAASQNIQSVRIFNCKSLRNLEGLNYLTNLKSIQIGMTAIEIDTILQQRLPASLKTFGFYTGKKKENARLRAKLDVIGYKEHER